MKIPPVASSLRSIELYEPDPGLVYSIEMAARMSRVPRRRIAVYYRYGLVSPVMDPSSSGWYFNDDAIRALRRIEYLRMAYGMGLPAIRMVLDLAGEVERLQEELRFLRGR